MVDIKYDGVQPQIPAALLGRALRWLKIGALALSLGFLFVAGQWTFERMMRSTYGIPVVAAPDGPMREAPQEPGGTEAAHQGLSVNEVAAYGVASPLPDEIVLAPRPVELAAEDVPGLRSVAVEKKPEPVPEPVIVASAAPQMPVGVDESDTPELQMLVAELSNRPAQSLAGGDVLAQKDIPAPVPARAAPAAADNAEPPVVETVVEVDAAELAKGTRVVQFQVFDSADEARQRWDRLALQFGDLFKGKKRSIQGSYSGGRAFYRLWAFGFENDKEAKRFCAQITEKGFSCTPTLVR